MKPEAIQVGKTYEGRPCSPRGTAPQRTVVALETGTPPYGAGWIRREGHREIVRNRLAPLVRYRNGATPGNTARLRGREYTCTLATFAAWARREVPS